MKSAFDCTNCIFLPWVGPLVLFCVLFTGSEKWNLDVAMGDAHISELTNINSSLHTLGR